MSIYPDHFRHLIVRDTTQLMGMWSPSAENLLMGTCAQESRMAYYLTQYPKGPARGPFQMESEKTGGCSTFEGVLSLVVPKAKEKSEFLRQYNFTDDPDRMVWDLQFATIMCRLQYWRFEEPLPAYDDIKGLATYWKRYYNSVYGKGTVKDFIANYKLTRADYVRNI